jgi:hypothetical protein
MARRGQASLGELNDSTPGKMQHHLVMPKSLAAFYQAKVSYQAVMAAAHASQPRVRESLHRSQDAFDVASVNACVNRFRFVLKERTGGENFDSPQT